MKIKEMSSMEIQCVSGSGSCKCLLPVARNTGTQQNIACMATFLCWPLAICTLPYLLKGRVTHITETSEVNVPSAIACLDYCRNIDIVSGHVVDKGSLQYVYEGTTYQG